ncbi:DUF6541 family protein [Arthrobacter sp. GMC3]|uniref:DUF6541 family protein n=1 Tax=Arthrobacter sp. GMC3 TaxID=2058894 RepID=UPI002795398B|nr:DUF6541 family protein [Arthrobacter sp. GMC3]
MTWLEAVPLVLLAGAVFVVPGLIFSLAVRVRGLSALMLAPVFTVAMASVLSLVLPLVGVRWAPSSYAIGVLVISAAAFGIRTALSRKWADPVWKPERRSVLIASVVGLLGAGALIALQMGTAFIKPENISQTFDNVFHLNAVRWAIESGNASPLNLGAFTGISAYPSAWHAMTSLVAMATGASIPVAVNVTSIAIGSIVWPLGALYLVRQIIGQRLFSNIVALIFIPAFTGFPLMMVDWGVLYPNLLSIALLPAAMGLTVSAMGLGNGYRPSSPFAWLLVLVAIPAVAVAHPSTLMALLAFVLPAILLWAYGLVLNLLPLTTPGRRRQLWIIIGATIVSALLLAVVWRKFRPPPGAAGWGAVESPSQAIGELLFGGAMGRPAAAIIAICMLVGLARIVVTRKQLWLLGTFLVAGVLFFYAAGLNFSPRWFLTGVWYYDSYRLAALLPVAMIGPAAIGATYLWDTACRWIVDFRMGKSEKLSEQVTAKTFGTIASYTAGILLLVVATQYGVMNWAVIKTHHSYVSNATSALLTPDETALLERIDEHVEPGAVIAGVPSTGAALAYAFSGREVMQPHILTTHGEDVDVVNAGLKSAKEYPWVCDAVKKLNVKYVLDFGTRTVTGTMAGMGGLMDLSTSSSLELIDQQGPAAKLYKVTACW